MKRNSAANAVSEGHGTILIVDDQPDNLAFVSAALEAAAYMVLIAQDGVSAMRSMERMKPDLILLDVVMPAMNGYDLCRRLKLTPAWADIPIIFMTAMEDSEYVVAGFDAGGIDYVTKPANPDELLARVAAHLRLARAMKRGSDVPAAAVQAAPASIDGQDVDLAPVMARYRLTLREADVLHWVCYGKTNQEIGQILNISPRTINKHLEHIYTKLGVETRTAATAMTFRYLAGQG